MRFAGHRILILSFLASCTSHSVGALSGTSDGPADSPEELGALLFADKTLSRPDGQSCSDCHTPNLAFVDFESEATSAGAVPGRFGARNAPTAMYARFTPPLHRDANGEWVGGLFWDGHADTLEKQAELPIENPLEMNSDKETVVAAVRAAKYADDFRAVYGATALDDVDRAFAHVLDAIGAYERAGELSPFSSKYDLYLAGKAKLSDEELRGLALFEDPKRGNCSSCHPSRTTDGSPPLFTTFGYANLGVPRFVNSRYYTMPADLNPDGKAYVDHGLMTTVHDPAEDGKFRIPTLRNAEFTFPYAHNGYFASLDYIVAFIGNRDVAPGPVGPWDAPEVPATVDHEHTGHANFNEQEVDDLVAFLRTLTDGYEPPADP
jgi:cytochrome c peroxidase